MTKLIKAGLSGTSFSSTLRLYLVTLVVSSAPIMLVATLFGKGVAFRLTPIIAACLVLLQFWIRRASLYDRPPGWRLRRIAEFCFSAETYAQVLEPTLADLQQEFFDALAKNDPWKARFVLIRGHWSFWMAVVYHAYFSLIRRIHKLLSISRT